MPVVDTNVVVALLDPAHEHHEAARRDLAAGQLILTWGTLQEMCAVIRRRAKVAGRDGNAAARAALVGVTGLEGFRAAPQVGLDAVRDIYGKENALSFADAWTLAVAVATREPLLTYDDDLRRAFGRRS